MSIEQYFNKQIEAGATEVFNYALETDTPFILRMIVHNGTLDSFPTNLEFVKMVNESIPVFKEV
jgi:hypothetical protein